MDRDETEAYVGQAMKIVKRLAHSRGNKISFIKILDSIINGASDFQTFFQSKALHKLRYIKRLSEEKHDAYYTFTIPRAGENMVGISLLLSVANADKEIMLDLAATSTYYYCVLSFFFRFNGGHLISTSPERPL